MGKPINEQDNWNTNGLAQNPDNINRNGRPKKIYTILKDKGYSKDDVRACFGELLMYNQEELEELSNDKTKPAITIILAKHLSKAIESGVYEKGVMDMMDRFAGKATQIVDQTVTDTRPIIAVRDEQAKSELDKMEEM